jgi:hypothetical protein
MLQARRVSKWIGKLQVVVAAGVVLFGVLSGLPKAEPLWWCALTTSTVLCFWQWFAYRLQCDDIDDRNVDIARWQEARAAYEQSKQKADEHWQLSEKLWKSACEQRLFADEARSKMDECLSQVLAANADFEKRSNEWKRAVNRWARQNGEVIPYPSVETKVSPLKN